MNPRALLRTLERVGFHEASDEDLQHIVDRCMVAFWDRNLDVKLGSRVRAPVIGVSREVGFREGVVIEITYPRLELGRLDRLQQRGSVRVQWDTFSNMLGVSRPAHGVSTLLSFDPSHGSYVVIEPESSPDTGKEKPCGDPALNPNT